jgi:hypothetical protein
MGRSLLETRNELAGVIELIEHILARRGGYAQIAYSTSLFKLSIKVG